MYQYTKKEMRILVESNDFYPFCMQHLHLLTLHVKLTGCNAAHKVAPKRKMDSFLDRALADAVAPGAAVVFARRFSRKDQTSGCGAYSYSAGNGRSAAPWGGIARGGID